MCQGAIVIRSRRVPVEIRFMACTGFLDGRFLDGIIRIRIRVLGLLGCFSLGRLFALWGTSGFLSRCGDQVLSDCLSGDGTDTFFFFLGIPEGYTFEGAVINAPSGSYSDSSELDTVIVGRFLFLVACDWGVGEGVGSPLEDLMDRPGVCLALQSVGLALGEPALKLSDELLPACEQP